MVKMGHEIERSWFYENLHLGTPGDLAFYERVLRDGKHALELGGGTGRLARGLAQHVERYSVLELDPRLLAYMQKELGSVVAQFYEADMRDFTLSERFDRILLPYNALYCAGGIDGVSRLFSRVAAHLTPDGEFWLDAYGIDGYHEALTSGEASSEVEPPEVVLRTPWRGKIVEVTEQSEVDVAAQRLTVTYRAFVEGELRGEEVLHHDYLTTSQITAALGEAGLTIEALFSDFEGTSHEDEAGHLVVCATLGS